MYLKRIETSGFKSFANKTVLDFPKGVTAIVGPNGSGKSNIADAVKWVLGEQSMKSLRGKKGEDIIFTGSNKKAKMSAASVSLFIDNNDKKIPIDYDEVILSRKLFRSGDSEYLINRNKVRLSDIIDLLVRSGVSQRGYCVINQGMADSILAASSSERMVIFEEATGVRKFRIKKHQTIKKLDSTKRNLMRVQDILKEIEPGLSFLKRQASRAQKRGEVERELQEEQTRLFSGMWIELNKNNIKHREDRDRLKGIISGSEIEIGKIKEEIALIQDKNDDYDSQFEKLREDANEVQERMNEFRKNLSIAEGRMQIEKEKKERAENPEFVPINLGHVKEKLSKIISLYDRFLEAIGKMSNADDFKKAEAEGSVIKKEINLLFAEIKEGKVSSEKEIVKFDNSNLAKFENERKEIGEKIRQLEVKYEEARKKMAEFNKEEQKKRKSYFELERNSQMKQDELNRFKDNMNLTNIELAKFEVRKEDLITEIKEELGNGSGLLMEIENNNLEISGDIGLFNQDESRLKIRKLKVQFEQIGGIDPLVVEEYEETQKRFEFLMTQSKDLEEASGVLRKIIKELDEKIETRFKKSFKNINDEFDKYFKIIFSGGKAGLSIKYEAENNTEEENNEGAKEIDNEFEEDIEGKSKIAGIEINVSPPGKKINSLDMLSGGERALASIAVLFAIIANNPPPFSVLDEIDAALDEANSAKFSEMLREVSSKTQFIVITHNREMMKQADVLYGVTMQDDGVSKIISLKLEEIKEK